jgi:hypothetical protein
MARPIEVEINTFVVFTIYLEADFRTLGSKFNKGKENVTIKTYLSEQFSEIP